MGNGSKSQKEPSPVHYFLALTYSMASLPVMCSTSIAAIYDWVHPLISLQIHIVKNKSHSFDAKRPLIKEVFLNQRSIDS